MNWMTPREAGEVLGTPGDRAFMAESILFDKQQSFWVGEALEIAETLAEDYFRVDLENVEHFPYDLQTLANLRDQEKTHHALAQVCKYKYHKREARLKLRGNEFYRICLQDDKILNTVRTETPSLLKPLLLYVVTHELIHVVRFIMDPNRFYLNPREKRIEERDVHRKTYELLSSVKDPKVGLLLERYRPWWGEVSGPDS
jgi:hypothetical protein